ncbi:MAG: toll/interleukin-1 receptor domain-containing protein, partial [Mariniphaga sp.]|nr:toll/interleukin-1 receptor domain-containing protein [Mariniphaga sp.]
HLEVFTDRKLIAGSDWHKKIMHELNIAHVIVFLVSKNFAKTDYIWEKEMPRAMERHEANEAVVIPVIVEDCDWETAPFAKLTSPDKANIISSSTNKAVAWKRVVDEIKKAIESAN